MTDLARLFQQAFSGRAILLAGQVLEPEADQQLRRALADQAKLSPELPLAELCGRFSDPASITAAANTIAKAGPSSALRSVADVPWAAVFSSALDDRLSTQLAEQNSEGRRLRHLCVDEELPAFFPRRNDVLTVLHLSHVAHGQTATGLPLYGRHVGRAQRLLIPGILRLLPQAVGPAHMLCIAGIGQTDLIDVSVIADFVSDLDPDNVYWFIAPADGLDVGELKRLLPNIHFIESELSAALETYLASAENTRSATLLKQQVLEANDLLITVATPDATRVLTFRASELREFRRHLVIVPDFAPAVAPVDGPRRRQDFIAFLSTNRQTPDWTGLSEGFVFERNSYKRLLELTLARVAVMQGPGSRQHVERRGEQSVPIFLAGPPASGRTIGLLWLGYQLRRKGVFVVHLLPSGGMVDNGAVEQILRLAEGRGAPAIVVLLDRADRRAAENLDRHLRSAGRRTVVVASVAPEITRSQTSADREPDEEESPQGSEIVLEYSLSEDERERFRNYLLDNNSTGDPDLVLQLLSDDPSVFALLYRLIPDTRQNIRSVIVEEYLDVVEGLVSFRPPKQESFGGGALREQLKAWLAQRKRQHFISEDDTATGLTDLWHNIATQLPQLVILFSSLDEAISLNLLTKRFPGLLQAYGALREILENSGLFVEVALDKESDIGLAVVNAFVAQLLLEAAVPSSVARINLLATLLKEFPWDPDARPIDKPEQAQLIHLIRSISPPSGSFQSGYQRTEDLRALADVLKELREQHGAALPQLMLIEGIVLRHIGRRLGGINRNTDSLSYYHRSRSVLEMARDVLTRRRPSPGRNFEISMVLNAIATTIGHSFNAEWREQQVNETECRSLVEKALETASESRAYTDAYHPLDTAFWTNRDFYNYLADRPETENVRLERQQALLSMADALDKAGELGELPHDQADRFGGRVVELQSYLGKVETAREIAEGDAQKGRFGGVSLLARLEAIDVRTNRIIGALEAKHALNYLEGFAPRILSDDRALTLMHRLWIGAHLENRDLDEGPYAIGCSSQEWRQLESIVAARRTLAGNTRIPYVNFWLAVALAHQGDMRRALQMIEEVQANSLAFSHRRLTPLVYLSNEDGSPKQFGAVMRRREDDDLLVVYVPALGIEVKVSKRYQGPTAMINLQRGDEVTVLIALNYWNPTGVGPAWETSRSRRTAPVFHPQPSRQPARRDGT